MAEAIICNNNQLPVTMNQNQAEDLTRSVACSSSSQLSLSETPVESKYGSRQQHIPANKLPMESLLKSGVYINSQLPVSLNENPVSDLTESANYSSTQLPVPLSENPVENLTKSLIFNSSHLSMNTETDNHVEITRKRRQISVKEKLAIVKMVEDGQKLTKVARTFGISTSTASSIMKERFKIKLLSEHYNIAPDRKRMRLGLFKDIDEAVNIWLQQMRAKNSPVNGPMLQQKAREFALLLGHDNFEGSSGWLSRFRERFGLTGKSLKEDKNSPFGIGMTDDEIVASICPVRYPDVYYTPTNNNNNNNNIQASYEPNAVEPEVSLRDAMNSVEKLTSFLRAQENVPDNVWMAMHMLEYYIFFDLSEKYKQKKITDYFKPYYNTCNT